MKMNTTRLQRALPLLALILSMLVPVAAGAQGSDYPNRPMKLVVPFAAGGSAFDIGARVLADKWSQALGQPVLVENRTGAGGLIAMQSVMRAAPDGYTLVTFNADLMSIIPSLQKTPPYDPLKDFAFVGTLMRFSGMILAVNPKLPVRTIEDLVRVARASPNALNYGTYGIGSLPHLGFEALNAKLGLNLAHVPYKGGAASFQAAMVGEVQFVAGGSLLDLVRDGRLRAIAVGGPRRLSQLPETPTFAELGLGDEMFGTSYFGIAAPAGTPQAIIDRLGAELKKVSAMPDVAERLSKFAEATYIPPAEMSSMIRRDVNFFVPLVKSLGLANQ